MIKFENVEVVGWEAAIRGMRNPMNSWEKSDSLFGESDVDGCSICPYNMKCTNDDTKAECLNIGSNDLDLMMGLRNAGTDHRKFMRMITVYVDITAPLYWWKEFDTYKVGTVANSCSTMHKIQAKEFTWDDFSCEDLFDEEIGPDTIQYNPSDLWFRGSMLNVINHLNAARERYMETKDKKYWWQMIQLLPTSYNQKRTVMLNYEVLANIYNSRKNHKLDEWKEHTESTCNVKDDARECKNSKEWLLCEDCSVGKGFCDWIKTLPYSELLLDPDLSSTPICNEIIEEAKKRVKAEEN